MAMKPRVSRAQRRRRGTVEVPGELVWQVIEALGGLRPIAERLGVSHTAVWHWAHRGRVPARRLLALAGMLRERAAQP